VISEFQMRSALRTKAMALTVATTGAVSLSANATGYARTTGSFLTDGFAPGMEAIAAGFANNGPLVITEVTALTIAAKRVIATTVGGVTTYALAAPPVEVAAGGRSLIVGLPSLRAWENKAFQPTAGIPWVREEFSPGPVTQRSMGPFGTLIAAPQYTLHISVPADTGLAPVRYTDAARVLFAPRTQIALANGDTLRVHADTAPYTGPLLESQPGFSEQPFVIPLWLETRNVI
jgi:hypothetical protein